MRISKSRPMTHQEQVARTGMKKIGHSQQAVMGCPGAIADSQILLRAWMVAKAQRRNF